MVNRNQLLDLWSRPEMDGVRKSLVADCPPVLEWTPGKKLEDWAAGTALRQGYLLCLSNLGIKHE